MKNNLTEIAKLIRYYILTSTTQAGSGHPTTSLSAADLATVLFFDDFLQYFIDNPKHPNNDRVVFSKGHASPLLYALWAVAGAISPKELSTLRQFTSRLEGHPTPIFPYSPTATGSLGQGLSIGAGFALNAKYLDRLPYQTYVLLGDGELAEGSVWEALAFSSFYKLGNLTAIVDVNRLEQVGSTMLGWDLSTYQKRFQSFGWKTILIKDGHNIKEIQQAFKIRKSIKDQPTAIIAKTIKGKGVSFLEDKENWHGKVLNKQQLTEASKELRKVNFALKPSIVKPKNLYPKIKNLKTKTGNQKINYPSGIKVATRKAYGNAIKRLGFQNQTLVSLDAGTSNSTFSQEFKLSFPNRFFEMYIAEQNMVGVGTGLALSGKIPFLSTFAAFLTRAHDQIRMSQYSNASIKFVGSHAGVSIGEDGSSQMGLEDLAMFCSVLNSVVLYPADAISTEKIVEEAIRSEGIVYIRTTRKETPILYQSQDKFPIGKSKTIKTDKKDVITVIGCGITLFETLKAYENLKKQGVFIRVIDCYSIKPIDRQTLIKACQETRALITVEDHYPAGGLGSAVIEALADFKNKKPIYVLAVNKIPKSGKPEELLSFEEIDAQAITKKVKQVLKNS